jgi:hypothetical protein
VDLCDHARLANNTIHASGVNRAWHGDGRDDLTITDAPARGLYLPLALQ